MPLAEIGAEVFLFGGAILISVIAFTALILVPALGSFGRGWEKATAGVLSLFVLVVLLVLGFALGALVVVYWGEISALFT